MGHLVLTVWQIPFQSALATTFSIRSIQRLSRPRRSSLGIEWRIFLGKRCARFDPAAENLCFFRGDCMPRGRHCPGLVVGQGCHRQKSAVARFSGDDELVGAYGSGEGLRIVHRRHAGKPHRPMVMHTIALKDGLYPIEGSFLGGSDRLILKRARIGKGNQGP